MPQILFFGDTPVIHDGSTIAQIFVGKDTLVDENESNNEKRGHWVGFADSKGDHLTWKMLTDETQQIITRSAVKSTNKTSPNLRLDPPKGEDQPQDLTSEVFVYGRLHCDGSEEPTLMSTINFDDLLARTCLLPMDENGETK